jgi:hypothetical protein
MNNTEITQAIKDLKDGLNSKFTPEQFKPRMEAKIKELESQLSGSTNKSKPAPLKERYSSSDTNPNAPKARVTSAQRQNARYDKIWASKLENDKKREAEAEPTPWNKEKAKANSEHNKSVRKAEVEKIWNKEKAKANSEHNKSLKKSVPVAKASTKYAEDEDGYCDKVIAQAKERRAKAKARSQEPQKTEGTKNKEKIEKVVENVKERAKNDSISVSELKKLISETEELLNVLKSRLSKMK